MSTTRFTFTELDFIMQNEAGWPEIRKSLNFGYEVNEGLLASGAASLMARELAEVKNKEIVVSGEAMAPARALLAGGKQLALILSDGASLTVSALQLAPDHGPRVLITAVAPGVFDLRILDHTRPAIDLLTELILNGVPVNATMAIAYGEVTFQVVRDEKGNWSTRVSEDAEPLPCDVTSVRAQIAENFGPSIND